MAYEREQALGKYLVLKKQIYELGIKAQSFVQNIQEAVNSFTLSESDFTSIDFKKVIALSSELLKLQKEFSVKSEEMNRLKKTYNITED
ncbi:MAG: hypothetical protein GYA14_16830 [Ignavibacteria bacterium]|nr:hypothetical protein [Ignavibacteria bacterium]